MIDIIKFKNACRIANKSISVVAKENNLNPSTLYRQLKNGSVTISTAHGIKKSLNLTDKNANEIFFAR